MPLLNPSMQIPIEPHQSYGHLSTGSNAVLGGLGNNGGLLKPTSGSVDINQPQPIFISQGVKATGDSR